jgi:hypothetical protein
VSRRLLPDHAADDRAQPHDPHCNVAPKPNGGEAVSNAFRRGSLAVMPAVGAILPDRCVVCNAPAGGFRLHKRFRWQHVHEPTFLEVVLSVLPYENRSASVALGLCERHRARRRNGFLLGGVGFLLGLAVLIAGITSNSPEGLLAISGGAVVMLAALAAGFFMARVATQNRIDAQYLWLEVGQPFLDGLPPG